MTSIYIRSDTPLPARMENDLYVTEPDLIRSALLLLAHGKHNRILDIGAGDGRWGTIAMELEPEPISMLCGIEIEDRPKPDGFTGWLARQDFLDPDLKPWLAEQHFDMIVSNPPYALAEPIIRTAWDVLDAGGEMLMLLRLAFMEGVNRYHGLWVDIPPVEVAVCSRRPSFYGGGTNGTAFGVFYWGKWSKKHHGGNRGTPRRWRVSLLMHDREQSQ